jgi:hypothetical protein
MKKLLILCILSLAMTLLMAMPTAKSIFYADSYMLRSQGVEANYWNPARLQVSQFTDLWLPGVNSAITVSNNALDLDTYNYFVTRDTLLTADKERLLRDVKGKLSAASEASISHFGFTIGNTALSSSTRFFAKANAQEDILRLALYGNVENSYSFSRASNNVSALAYSDISYGAGDFSLPFLPDKVPAIKAGFSVSLLVGLANLSTEHFSATLSTDEDGGTSAHQEMVLRSSTFGTGFKAMLGMYSELLPGLEAGLTVDNLFGGIRWLGANEERRYSFAIDSLFAASIQDDFYSQTQSTEDIDSYGTYLPPELRLAAKYNLGFMDVSADWVQGFEESAVTSSRGRLSCAAGISPLPFLPLSFGIAFPNSVSPLKTSYSIGIYSKLHELAIAVQTYNSILPGYKSKGVSLATSLRFWF